jgi:hypothetical protein
VPVRIFGRGVPAPGTLASAAAAEAHARALLSRHAALLAPGIAAADLDAAFELVANDLDAGTRTVAFAQRALGAGPAAAIAIEGASVSFRYKSDRLFVLASSAIPGGRAGAVAVSAEDAERVALGWIRATHAQASVAAPPQLSALPLRRTASFELATAWRVRVEAVAPRARYDVWIDARSGREIAREQLLRFANGTVLFDAPLRGPSQRQTLPAPLAELSVDGAVVLTDALGAFSWASGAPATVQVGAYGDLVNVGNFSGDNATASFAVSDGGQALWSLASDEMGDAQLSGYVHSNIAKARVRAMAPDLGYLDATLAVRVNKDESEFYCNAYWDGTATNFMREFSGCNNTARLADVVYHEFGHAMHQHAIVPGAGAYDSSLSEGASDYLAATITGDPIIAPEFHIGGGALREIDSDLRWPDDISYDPHMTGLIFAGAAWDLRTRLSDELGPEGIAIADTLYYQSLRRASDIPTTYVEMLVADDDDGDLENGTPHVCAITDAFVRHNLAGAMNAAGLTLAHDGLSVLPPGDQPYPVYVRGSVRWPECTGAALGDVNLVLRRRDASESAETIALQAEGDDYVGEIPGKIQGSAWAYRIEVDNVAGIVSLPDNAADDEYRFFVGETTELYCTDFETEPTDWVTGDVKTGSGDFAWGTPMGQSGDPTAAFSGDSVMGNDLGGSEALDGAYRPKKQPFLDGPPIELDDHTHVRLQFRRWLTVEDGYFDQASIHVNGSSIWTNEGTDESGALNHRDREWRFEDIDLSAAVSGDDTAQIRFDLTSDSYTQLGGWNIDDVCLMAWQPAPLPEVPKSESPDEDAPDALGPALSPGGGCGCRTMPAGGHVGSVGVAIAAMLIALRRRGDQRVRARST